MAKIVEVIGGSATLVKVTEKVAARIEGMISIRDAARCLIAAQCISTSESMLSVYRTALSVAYDSFVAKWGYLTDRANRAAFRKIPTPRCSCHWKCVTSSQRGLKRQRSSHSEPLGRRSRGQVFVQRIRPLAKDEELHWR